MLQTPLLPIPAAHDIFTPLCGLIRVTLTSSGVFQNTRPTSGHEWEIICSWSNFIRKLILSQWHWYSTSQVVWLNGRREQLASTPCVLQYQPRCFPIIHWWTSPLCLSLYLSPMLPLEIFDLNTIDFVGYTYYKTLTELRTTLFSGGIKVWPFPGVV